MFPFIGSGCHSHTLSENNAVVIRRFKIAASAWSKQNMESHRNKYFAQAQALFMFQYLPILG